MENDERKFVDLYEAIIKGAKNYSDVANALGHGGNIEPVKELYKPENRIKRDRVRAVKDIYERKRRDDATKKYDEKKNQFQNAKGDNLEGDTSFPAFPEFYEKYKTESNFPSFSKFHEKYRALYKDSVKCHYCGIDQTTIKKLFESDKIRSKRKTTRGMSLELERIEPNKSYSDLNNLTLACYWCNNAKSDEFSAEEFKSFAEGIGKVLRARLSQLSSRAS